MKLNELKHGQQFRTYPESLVFERAMPASTFINQFGKVCIIHRTKDFTTVHLVDGDMDVIPEPNALPVFAPECVGQFNPIIVNCG